MRPIERSRGWFHGAVRLAASVTLGATVLAPSATWGEGLRVAPTAAGETPQWQARLGFTTPAPLVDRPLQPGWAAQAEFSAPPVLSASLMGDYYVGWQGLRATGGLLLGRRTTPWTSAPRLGSSVAMERHLVRLGALSGLPEAGDFVGSDTVPYLGVGYSSNSLRGRWGFAADLGLMALSPGTVGGAFSGQRSTEEVLRDLRLTPTLQLGVSYSF